MFTTQDIIDSLGRETALIKHLYEKVTPEMLDYKPTEKQRTLREHLFYMTTMWSNIWRFIKDGGYNHDKAVARGAEQAARGLENFPTMMDEQLVEMSAFLNSLSEDDLTKELDLFGSGVQTIKWYILEVMLKNFPAYRMMLFLYLKAAGAHHLGTANVWGGRDSF